MKYVVFILALVYALLSIYASLPQWKKANRRVIALLLTAGAAALIVTGVLCLTGWQQDWLLSLIGCLLILEAAVLNGKTTGRTHPKHHTVRFVITLALTVGFILW